MTEVTTIGLDLAKKVFQVHAVDAAGAVVTRRSLRRGQVVRYFAKLPACLVGMERVRRRTIGRARSASSDTTCG